MMAGIRLRCSRYALHAKIRSSCWLSTRYFDFTAFRAMLMSSALARSVCSFRKGMAPFFREVNSFPFGLIDGNAPTKRSI